MSEKSSLASTVEERVRIRHPTEEGHLTKSVPRRVSSPTLWLHRHHEAINSPQKWTTEPSTGLPCIWEPVYYLRTMTPRENEWREQTPITQADMGTADETFTNRTDS